METIPLSLATLIINALGMSGVIFIIWYFDNRRFQAEKELRLQEMAERERAIQMVLAQYREDTLAIKRLYEANVGLVEDYESTCKRLEHLYDQTINVISLNTQVMTQLSERIAHNMYCPIVRKESDG